MKDQIDANIGQVLINRYQLKELVGQGSMGKVYRAEDQLLGEVTVAVKFLSQSLLNGNMKQRFADEARTGAQLGQRSIHIVRVLDYGVHNNDMPFYVMEYMEGKNLSDLIIPQPLSVKRFLRLARHICLGLQCAHEGIKVDGSVCKIVHRDIKPSNVFVITDPGLGEVAKVLDFGIAKFFSDTQEKQQTRSFMGTLAYCSPEQIDGKDLDTRSDIYSLGITMFETLTGVMPIEPDNHTLLSWYKAHRDKPPKQLSEVAPHLRLPTGLEALVMGCMEKRPDNRPQSVSEILHELKTIQRGKETAAGASRTTQSTVPPQSTARTTRGGAYQTRPTQIPSVPQPQKRFWSIEEAGWQVSWPMDKPRAEIVFPQTLQSGSEEAIALWLMLSNSEVRQRMLSTRYNQFLCTMSPHPMMLWITAIYDPSLGARWLPCYLDLKQPNSQKILKLLSLWGFYFLIFFAKEFPEDPANVKTATISTGQRQLFQEWLKMADRAISTASSSLSKQLLKTEFERIKPSLLRKMETETKKHQQSYL